MNTDYTEQPFNLEIALKHPEWVRTRDGREIDFIKEYPEKAQNWPIVVLLTDGYTMSCTIDGFYHCKTNKSPKDLILRVPYRTVYTVLYPEKDAYWYDTEAEALADSKDSNYIAITPVKIPITI
jgi:hypothetical protein